MDLSISTEAGRISYETLLKKMAKSAVFDTDNPPTVDELAEWRIWSKSVFMPLNEYREKLILENAYLIREEEMPQCLVDFVTHASEYKAIIEKWNMSDFSEHTPMLDFPVDLDTCTAKVYCELKSEQLRLIVNSNSKISKRKGYRTD